MLPRPLGRGIYDQSFWSFSQNSYLFMFLAKAKQLNIDYTHDLKVVAIEKYFNIKFNPAKGEIKLPNADSVASPSAA